MLDRLRDLIRGTSSIETIEPAVSDDAPSADDLASLTKQWEVVVAVQKHFNDLEWRIRSLALTALTAIVGFALSETVSSRVMVWRWLADFKVSYSAFLGLLGCLIWTAFFMSDYKWYHPMLGGAGLAANTLENEISARLGLKPDDMLSHRIYVESKNAAWRKGHETHSKDKLKTFYLVGYLVLFAQTTWSLVVPNLPATP